MGRAEDSVVKSVLINAENLGDWLAHNEQLVWWLASSSLAVILISLMLIPWIIVRIPADYFVGRRRQRSVFKIRHPLASTAVKIFRNLFAVLLVSVGILLLILPGQGLLTIFMGILIADFPGRHRLVIWLVSRPNISRPLNWIRRRAGRPPLQTPDPH